MKMTKLLGYVDIKNFYSQYIPDFPSLKPNANGWVICKSPLRNDTHPSFSVHIETGSWKDFATNEHGNIYEFLKRKENVDFATAKRLLHERYSPTPSTSNPPKPMKTIITTYDYTDENDQPLYQAVRFEPKSFQQRRPDGSGGWIWNLNAVRRVMYRLPRLLEWLGSSHTIHIPEGEKDADALINLGLAATTTAGGVNAPLPADFKALFRGASVVIWGDNDTVGKKFAERKADLLVEVAATVRICYAPEGKDISEWIEKGATKRDIERLFGETPLYQQTSVLEGKTQLENPNEVEGLSLPTSEFILECLNADEYGDGKLFQNIFHNKKCYDHTAQLWMNYENGCWRYDRKELTAQDSFDALYTAYKSVISVSGRTALDRITKLQRVARTKNVLEWARKRPMGVLTEEFDAQNHLLNLKNGVFDLQTQTFRAASANDLMMKQAGAAYNDNAQCPHWLAFLNRIFNDDAETMRFVQQWVGVCLSGTTDLQAFFYAFGKGANGKSTFFAVIQELLGDYFVNIPVETLLQKKHNATDEYQMVRLHGARLVVCSEIPENRRPNEGQIKDLTGGELVNARAPYGKPFTFKPTHKLALFGNHKLKITGTDEGIWRRVFLVPFTVTIPPAERKPMAKMLNTFRRELSGILLWALQGWHEYSTNGQIFIPESVKKATAEYREESDALSPFLKECCELDVIGRIEVKKLFEAYQKWCTENREIPVLQNTRMFLKSIREHDFTTRHGAKRVTEILGLRLKGE
jgi:putative DNA primase/helicase